MQKVRCDFKKRQQKISIKFQNFSISQNFFHQSLTVRLNYQTLRLLDFEGGASNIRANSNLFSLYYFRKIKNIYCL